MRIVDTPIEDPGHLRFAFGANWARFLAALGEERIRAAERSLRQTLPGVAWRAARFLDVGSGSGLFSLAARRLGAQVVSLDVDPESVACTEALRRRFFPQDGAWAIHPGSALDGAFLESLGTFDAVYAWGSLHHTGELWRALDFVAARVREGGWLCVAVYNDQGWASRWWRGLKMAYNRLPSGLRILVVLPALARLWGPRMLVDLMRLRPFRTWRRYGTERGMSPWRDVIDWVGGYPFEVATPEAVFRHARGRGFTLEGLKTCGGGHGCNEFVFRRPVRRQAPAPPT